MRDWERDNNMKMMSFKPIILPLASATVMLFVFCVFLRAEVLDGSGVFAPSDLAFSAAFSSSSTLWATADSLYCWNFLWMIERAITAYSETTLDFLFLWAMPWSTMLFCATSKSLWSSLDCLIRNQWTYKISNSDVTGFEYYNSLISKLMHQKMPKLLCNGTTNSLRKADQH